VGRCESVRNDIKAGLARDSLRGPRKAKQDYTFEDFLADLREGAEIVDYVLPHGAAIATTAEDVSALARDRCRSGRSAADGFDRLIERGALARNPACASEGMGVLM
jgi:hypothetical protein